MGRCAASRRTEVLIRILNTSGSSTASETERIDSPVDCFQTYSTDATAIFRPVCGSVEVVDSRVAMRSMRKGLCCVEKTLLVHLCAHVGVVVHGKAKQASY